MLCADINLALLLCTNRFTAILLIGGQIEVSSTSQRTFAVAPSTTRREYWVYTGISRVSLLSPNTITDIKPGTTMVYAKGRDNSGKYATCYVTVIAPIASTGVSVSDTEVVLMPFRYHPMLPQ